jgi:hypothetical protein
MIFDFFKKSSNVVPFPTPYIETPRIVPESEKMYSIGVTTDKKITFTMGYTTLTMTKLGCTNLIEQLELFKKQLREDE